MEEWPDAKAWKFQVETDAWSSIHECHSLKMRSERVQMDSFKSPGFQVLEGFQRVRIIS